MIVALGGGSMIDAAKVLAASGGDFARVKRHLVERAPLDPATFLPIIAVPTTSGTGSEVTSWATVWMRRRREILLAHPRSIRRSRYRSCADARGAASLTMTTGLDALSHALESLWNVNANPASANLRPGRRARSSTRRAADPAISSCARWRAAVRGACVLNTKTALAQ